MIHGVFELIHKRCDEIMIPLSDLVMVRADTDRKALLKLARSRNVTRMPVYEDEPSHVIGILHIMDVAARPQSDQGTARDYMRPPQFVPHDTLVDDILPRMRLSRQPLALICDEKSRVTGMVTLEDALAEIVGTI
jgi:CBS domain containing-hemolysin-like protein